MNGEVDRYFIKAFLPCADGMISQTEAAVIEGAIPDAAVDYISEYIHSRL